MVMRRSARSSAKPWRKFRLIRPHENEALLESAALPGVTAMSDQRGRIFSLPRPMRRRQPDPYCNIDIAPNAL
jgi:hypothetical protein